MDDMQLILYNARLRGLDGLLPETAMAILDGKIYALGDDGEHHFFKSYSGLTSFKATQELYQNG